ncbi:hypothetical protein [Pseudooceanicola nanhaiensis]|uniref:hypothetical protein n=1 Tax=Pseudooceanicola nanhaiensis TaxID=375761 RepID=UPI001CD2B2E3|nr:hypothetical protein [Pseudooceanicola nanhaiensis]MCA0919703.1 hypothetical protein [Pseudooceanicola nanhaiensis]
MQQMNIAQQASALLRAHGPAAEAEAAARIRACEAESREDEAEDWRKIQRVIRELRQ